LPLRVEEAEGDEPMAKAKSGDRPVGAEQLEGSPIHLFHRALQVALDIHMAEFGPSGLTQRQFAVLAAVESAEGLTQTELVRITGIDRSTLADLAVRMIRKGLLERERSLSDARANAVRLSDEGRRVLEAARPRMAAADERLLRLLPGSRRERLLDLLRDLVRAGEGGASLEPLKTAKAEKPAKAGKGGKKKKKAKKLALAAA
jgi:MarR family transcriptional regulator, temperature-dependent positive regulator of motility